MRGLSLRPCSGNVIALTSSYNWLKNGSTLSTERRCGNNLNTGQPHILVKHLARQIVCQLVQRKHCTHLHKASARFPSDEAYIAIDGGGGDSFILPHQSSRDVEVLSKSLKSATTSVCTQVCVVDAESDVCG